MPKGLSFWFKLRLRGVAYHRVPFSIPGLRIRATGHKPESILPRKFAFLAWAPLGCGPLFAAAPHFGPHRAFGVTPSRAKHSQSAAGAPCGPCGTPTALHHDPAAN